MDVSRLAMAAASLPSPASVSVDGAAACALPERLASAVRMRAETLQRVDEAAPSGVSGALPGASRVLIVTYEYPPLGGGGGVIFRDLARELARSIDVTVLTSGREGLAAVEHEGRLEVVRVPVMMRREQATASLASMLTFFPASLRAGRRLLRERRYDLVHSSFAVPSGPSGLRLARQFGLPHVLSLHGGDIYDPTKKLSPHRTPLLKQTVRWVIRESERVVVTSSDIAERTRSIYLDRPLDRIPLAADPPEFQPLPRHALDLGLSDDDLVLVGVGRLVARKGLAQLIEIVAALRDPRVRLVLVGDGPQRQALEAQARSAGIAERVRFAGYVDDARKWQILSAADLYVSTALHEGFGIVFLEAMNAGLPVVCYDCGGQTDFVNDGVGRLVRSGDAAAFAAALRELSGDVPLRARLAEAARKVAAEFTTARYAERYQQVYAECLAAAQAAPAKR